MFALRTKAQRPERTAKYMEKFYPERGIGINRFPLSHLVQEMSNRDTGRYINLTPVSTPTLTPAKNGLAVTVKSVISTLGCFCKKLNCPRISENNC